MFCGACDEEGSHYDAHSRSGCVCALIALAAHSLSFTVTLTVALPASVHLIPTTPISHTLLPLWQCLYSAIVTSAVKLASVLQAPTCSHLQSFFSVRTAFPVPQQCTLTASAVRSDVFPFRTWKCRRRAMRQQRRGSSCV